MPRFELARNLIVSARQVDDSDAASVVLYGETSAPVDIREGADVGVQVVVTSLGGGGGASYPLDVYLLGSNDLWSWPPMPPVAGVPKLLLSATAPGTYTGYLAGFPTRYVRLLYNLNTDDWAANPPPVGTYYILDCSLRTGPEAST
jgi:hypothetical protein